MRLSEGLLGSRMTLPALQRDYMSLSEDPMRLPEDPASPSERREPYESMRVSEDPTRPQLQMALLSY